MYSSIRIDRAALSCLICLGLATGPVLAGDRSWSTAAPASRAEVPRVQGELLALAKSLAFDLDLYKGQASDPLGDTFGDLPTQIDVVELTADVITDVPVIFITFSAPVSPGDSGASNAVVGFLDIDVDQDGTTGDISFIDILNPAGALSGLGTEYYVNLGSYSSIDDGADVLDDLTDTVVGRTPVLFGGNQILILIDPLLIGSDDGAIDVATVVGTIPEATDVAPNTGSVRSDTSTLLQGGRFRTSVEWRRVPNFPTRRPAVVSDFRTFDSANFYFTNPDNLEFLVKVLDGCNNTGFFWVFFAGATNVEFTVTVEDLATGNVRQYFNPQGQPANAVTDTRAFATCP